MRTVESNGSVQTVNERPVIGRKTTSRRSERFLRSSKGRGKSFLNPAKG